MSKTYNGYPSYSQWNQSLWINNDEFLYNYAYDLVKECGLEKAVNELWDHLSGTKTGDGVPYNITGIRGALKDIL